MALAVCIGLFLFWTVVGYAVVTAFHAGRSRLGDLLIAPPIGLAVMLVSLFTLSRLGVPVRYLGWSVAAPVLAGAIFLLWRNRPRVPWRAAWPIGVVLIGALMLIATPLVKFGFDWVSYCNDDMANYALAGDRFYWHGYFDQPPADDVVRGRYYGNDFWFMHVATKARPGSEITLAWTRAATGLNEHESFMPLMVAFHLMLILAAAALVEAAGAIRRTASIAASSDASNDPASDAFDDDENADPPTGWRSWPGRFTTAPVLTAGMVSASALVALGTLYQLIAQVLGLSVMAVCAVLLLRPLGGMSRGQLLRHSLLTGIAGTGLLIIYPEVAPFLGLAFIGYVAVCLVRRRLAARQLGFLILVGAAVAVVLLRSYAIDAVQLILYQTRSGASDAGAEDPRLALFPYYLLPEGLADFWGLLRIAQWAEEPWQSIYIAIGAGLLLLALAATAWLCWRARPEALLAGAMFALALLLFKQRSGFGLFKLAMYIQPFMLGTIVAAWTTWVNRRRGRILGPLVRRAGPLMRAVPLVLIGVAGMRGQRQYVMSGLGIGSAFLEIRNPSASHMAREFGSIVAAHPSADVIISDTYNVVLGKFQALYTRGRELVFPSRVYFSNVEAARETKWRYLTPADAAYADSINRRRQQELILPATFDLHDPARPGAVNDFFQTDLARTMVGAGKGNLLVVTTPLQSIFNHRRFSLHEKANFAAIPFEQARDHLIFIASTLGPPYYVQAGNVGDISLYQMEEDPLFFKGGMIAAVGRYLLFQVINPSTKVRMAVDLTCSYQNDSINQLPPMAVVGSERIPFPVVGRGSMRIFSPPIEAQMINGRAYVMVDMGVPGRRLDPKRSGLMRLYGKTLTIDRRVLVGFARDISVVSEEEYQALAAPVMLDNFSPEKSNSLRDRDLEYSGLYEDGRVAEDVSIRLIQPAGTGTFVLKGEILQIAPDPQYQVEVMIDGKPAQVSVRSLFPPTAAPTSRASGSETVHLSKGPFSLEAIFPREGANRPHTIRVRFIGTLQHMPGGDGRPLAGTVSTLGFLTPPAAVDHFVPGDDNSLNNRELEYSGISTDGWALPDASLRLTQPSGATALKLRGLIPHIGENRQQKYTVSLLVDGKVIAESAVGVGDFELRGPVPAGAGIHTIGLRFAGPPLRLPDPDGRGVGGLIRSLGFELGAGQGR